MSQVLAQDMPSQGSFLAISTVMLDVFILHRDSERQLHFDTKFEHEEMVLVA